MSAEPQSEAKTIEAVIYLSTNRPLRVADFLDEFHKSWPLVSLEKKRKELHRALFRAGNSDFSLGLDHTPVRQAITDSVVHSTLHWPKAGEFLSVHQAHLDVAGSVEDRGYLTLACDLTKSIAALLPVTDSIAVCWLNGPALNIAKNFTATAHEMFSTGLYPLMLWVAARWDPQACTIHTQGMAQFEAPEIFLAQQSEPAPLMVDYLFQVAQYVLTSHHKITDGEKMEGPHGVLRIRWAKSGPAKRTLILEP